MQKTLVGISELHQVKTQTAHDVARGASPLTYDKYRTLLLSAAATYDQKQAPTSFRGTRNVLHHQLNVKDNNKQEVYFHDQEANSDESYSIDTD